VFVGSVAGPSVAVGSVPIGSGADLSRADHGWARGRGADRGGAGRSGAGRSGAGRSRAGRSGADLFDGVDDWEDRDHGGRAGADGGGHRLDQGGWGQRAGRVVDQDDGDVIWDLGQGDRHGLLALGAAGHDGDRGDRGEEGAHRLDVGGGGGDHDLPDRGGRGDPADRVDQQRLAGEKSQGFGATGAEPQTGAGRRNEDRDVTPSIQLRGHVAVLVSTIREGWWGLLRPR
jgi:hypothetical protein